MWADAQVARNATAARALGVGSSTTATVTPGGGGGGTDYVDPNSNTLPAPMVEYPKTDGSNTGCLLPLSSLATVSGNYTTKAAGEVIAFKHFTNGRVTIAHPNVTMKFCVVDKWDYVGGYGLGAGVVSSSVTNSATFRMWNCTIGSNTPSPGAGVRVAGGQLRRLNIFNATDGLWLYEGNVTLRDSWVHDQHHFLNDPSQGGEDSHNDSAQIKGGQNWYTYHNRFECWRVEDGQLPGAHNPQGTDKKQTASQGYYATNSECRNMWWEDNIFAGLTNVYISVTGYPALLGSGTGGTRPKIYDCHIRDNKFSTLIPQSDWHKTQNCLGIVDISGNVGYSGVYP